MDKKTVFVKTDKGIDEVSGQSDNLFGDAKRILHLVDDDSTVGEITKRAPPSLRDTLQDVLQELVNGGYIGDARESGNEPTKSKLKISIPFFKMATPKVADQNEESSTTAQSTPSLNKGSDLDFSFITSGATADKAEARVIAAATPEEENFKFESADKLDPAAKKAKLKTYDAAKERAKLEAAARARTEAEKSTGSPSSANKNTQAVAEQAREQAEANKARELIEANQARELAEANKAREQAEANRVREQAEAKARQEAERLKAEQAVQLEAAAKAAKMKAYEEAKERARIEVATRARIEAEINQKKEAEAARLKIEQEALKARIESEARINQEVEAARLKAEREAEKLRLELEAAKVKAEIEHRNRLEAEARARLEAEARIKREAEAERLKLEKERAELEVARVKAEAELRLREEAEFRVRAELEARAKAEELLRHGERRHSNQGSSVGNASGRYDQVDPAQKLRESFVESFGQIKAKQKSGSSDFKLDNFSLIDTGKIAALTIPQSKAGVLPAGGGKVKAALEQRAQREAEAQRIKAEQEAGQLGVGHENVAGIKAEQEAAARIKAEQEAAARIKAELEAAARIKVEQELRRLKAEQEEQEKAETEAKKLADQQSRQWEEAQMRAATQAKAEQERMSRQSAESNIKAKSISHRPRKPLPIGKILGGLFALMVIAVFALPYVWPTEEYIAPLENEMSAQLKQTVRVKKINFALVPLPRLELHSVVVGSGQEIKVDDVVLNFDISALFAATKSIGKVELNNVTLAGASMGKVLAWIQAAGGLEKYPVARMELRHVLIKSEEIKLPILGGSVNFDVQGKFSKAELKSDDGKLDLELGSQLNRLQLELNVRESNLPILSNIKFNDLNANAVVENGQISISDFFAHIHGGAITGKGVLNWSNGWKFQGQVNAKSIELQRLFPNFGVTGELYGDASFSMNNAALSQLDKDPLLEGAFEAKNGVINKLDFDTVARFGARPGVAGHSDFSEMAGTIKADSRGLRIFLSRLVSVATTVSGLVDVDTHQQLSGKLLVDIKGQGSVPLQLSGSATEPLLQAGR